MVPPLRGVVRGVGVLVLEVVVMEVVVVVEVVMVMGVVEEVVDGVVMEMMRSMREGSIRRGETGLLRMMWL